LAARSGPYTARLESHESPYISGRCQAPPLRMPPLEHLLLCWPISWSGSRVRVHGGVLPRNHEADIASGAVLSLRRRRLDIYTTAPCRRRDDPSMFSLGLSPHALRARRAPDACAGGTPGAEWRVPFLDSPKELDHETGTVPLSRVRGVVPSTWRAGALAWAAAKVHAPSESRMSQGVGRCHVEGPSRRETSQYRSAARMSLLIARPLIARIRLLIAAPYVLL
jgi:hypothetical protein